jgi:cell division topological specificity factor
MINGLMSFFGGKKESTASLAKERLQIIIAREHAEGNSKSPDFLPALKEELMAVLAKYLKIDANSVNVTLDRKGNLEVLDVNVVIPDVQPDTPSATPAKTSSASCLAM